MDDQAARLEQLEQHVRRLRRTARAQTVALVVLLAGLVLGAGNDPQELRLRMLTIEDPKGKPRIVASVAPDGGASLVIGDAAGTPRVNVGAASNGVALLSVMDGRGKDRIGAFTLPFGRSPAWCSRS